MGSGIWRPAQPAAQEVLAALHDRAGIVLPGSYLAQLAASNGGEGELGVEPGWISFWPAQEVIGLNATYRVPEFLLGFFGFGSNGGGELLAFDVRSPEPFPVVMVPFVPMDPEDAVQIARSFDELRPLIGDAFGGRR
jgi:hypothetical protein